MIFKFKKTVEYGENIKKCFRYKHILYDMYLTICAVRRACYTGDVTLFIKVIVIVFSLERKSLIAKI